MSSIQSRVVLAPHTVTPDETRLAEQRIQRLAPDLLDTIQPATTLYPPVQDPSKRRVQPRWER